MGRRQDNTAVLCDTSRKCFTIESLRLRWSQCITLAFMGFASSAADLGHSAKSSQPPAVTIQGAGKQAAVTHKLPADDDAAAAPSRTVDLDPDGGRSIPDGQPTSDRGRPQVITLGNQAPEHETHTDNGNRGDDATHETQPPPPTPGTARLIACVIGLFFLVFLQTFNISALTTTQGAVARDLDAFTQTSWFVSAYLIPNAALGPLCGKLSADFTPRRVLAGAAILMAVGLSVTAGARDFETFIAGRVISGMGGSGINVVSIILVLEISRPSTKGLAVGLLNSGFTLGVSLGAIVAGALLEPLGWRAIFWIQVPLTFLGGVAVALAIPPNTNTGGGTHSNKQTDLTTRQRLLKLDLLGALTLIMTLTLLLYALSSPKSIPLLPLCLSPLAGLLFILNEVYLAADPIIPLPLLRSRGLACTCLGTVGFMMGRWAVLFFAPVYALAVRAWPPALAGTILIPTNGGFALGGLLVGALHIRRRGSFYTPTLACYAIFPVTLAALAALAHHDASVAAFVVSAAVCGLATGAALNYNLAHLLHITPPGTAYVATAMLSTFRALSGSFGSAIGGGFFARALRGTLERRFAAAGLSHQEELIRQLLGAPGLVGSLRGVEHEVAQASYEEALRTLWLAAAGLAVAMAVVQACAGWQEHEGHGKERAGVVGSDELGEERQPLLAAETASPELR